MARSREPEEGRIDADLTPEILCDTPFVAMFTAPNPGPKTLSGTHTYLLSRPQAYVIDPGPAIAAYQDALTEWVQLEGLAVRGVLLSHGHPDHAPGARRLGTRLGAPVWASADMPGPEREIAGVDHLYAADQRFPIAGDTLRVIPAPGHAFDHVAFWLERARILFAGDTILGEGTTLVAPPEGDMTLYMATLARMRALEPRLIAPGHGPVIVDPEAKIAEYVEHRRSRERQVLAALDEGAAGIPELVRRIYADVDPALHALAAGSVAAQLQKLEREGRVWQEDGRYRLR